MTMNALADFWQSLPATAQDVLFLAVLLAPALALGASVLAGHRPYGFAFAIIRRFRFASLLFIALIAISVAVGTGLLAQERALREGTARAADPFDLIVSAPGSEFTMLLSTVFLQPSAVPLLPGALFETIASDERVRIAAPIGYGDSFQGAPIVGSIPAFVGHLSGDPAEGRLMADHREAVIGAAVDLSMGDRFTPVHGMNSHTPAGGGPGLAALAGEEGHSHEGFDFTVVGRMQPTGSPWDRAIIVPIEAVWEVHGLANGHSPDHAEQLGPPFDPDYFPGTPAVLVVAQELYQAYALRAAFSSERMMAFLPGSVLASLYSLLGDVREAMSLLAVLTQFLVTLGVLAGLAILARLFSRQMALLRAIGAPARFVFAVVWTHAATLIVAGSLIGIALGYGAAQLLSALFAARTDIALSATIGWPELHLVAGFVSLTLLVALLPALAVLTRSTVADLRA